VKIENVRTEKIGERTRLGARITWEDCDRVAQDLYFETAEEFSDALAHSPEAFVAAALTPALWAGETRIWVDAEICPEFLDNLKVVTRVFQHWFPQCCKGIEIEAKRRTRSIESASSRRAALFLSGGVDSLTALRWNRLNFPLSHPASVKDGIIVFGLEVEDPQAFEHVVEALSAIATDAGVTLIPVSANIRCLNDDWSFWWKAHMGPAVASVAYALSKRIASAIIASDYDVPNMRPHGSHPLVDPYFSSFDLKIRYDGIALSRLDKIRLLADWDVALNNLRVCNKPEHYQAGKLNCGECEKCIRTMLALLAVGALERATAFAPRELSADVVNREINVYETVLPFYEELIDPLFEIGRTDLSQVVRQAVSRARGESGFLGGIRKFDREHLNGGLRALKKAILPREG
jgi:hypothetical protein